MPDSELNLSELHYTELLAAAKRMQKDLAENRQIPAAFWLVWREDGGTPTYKHTTRDSATTEAARLARHAPGSRFFVIPCHVFVECVVSAPRWSGAAALSADEQTSDYTTADGTPF
jgi:hypothetical protein